MLMVDEIISKFILTIIGSIASGLFGYFIAKIKAYKKKDNIQEKALKCLLRSSITKIYYEYVPKGYIPRYERENVIYLHDQYKEMKANSYVDTIYPEILKLPIEERKQ